MCQFECPRCEMDFDSDYEDRDVWYEPCSDGSSNPYVYVYCPHCEENVSVPL